jgi:hypothetical protein
MIIGTFRIGEDIAIALDVLSGDIGVVSEISAFMIRSKDQTRFRPDQNFTPLAMTVAPRAAEGEIPEGWNLILASTATEGLKEGVYGVDAKIVATDDIVDITDTTALIRFTKAAVA